MNEDVRLVALGDSIVHGHMVPEDGAWPSVLLALLRDRNPRIPWNVFNSGACGETAVQGLQRLERDALRHRPDVLFIAFGLNDCFLAHSATDAWRVRQTLPELVYGPLGRFRVHRAAKQRLGLDPSEADTQESDPQPRLGRHAFVASLEQMIGRARSAGVQHLYLMTMTPVDERAHDYWARELRERQLAAYDQYNRAIRATAQARSTKLIDVETCMTHHRREDILDFDGVHLTPMGQEALAQIVFRTLEQDGTLDTLEARGRTCSEAIP
jgi:lysophospholipase L1-like esterase